MDFGILVVDKPTGPTSHDVVDVVRRHTGLRRVGHTGTLDPMASGVLVLCVGRATRLVEYFTSHEKRYQAKVLLGQATDTYDATGRITSRGEVAVERDGLEQALTRFRGPIRQRPPAYSAVHSGGRRAHELARLGHAVDLPERPVTIHQLTLLRFDSPLVELEVHCSSGTYIRSLAHDLGRQLGCGAHLGALRRTATGIFSLEQAVTLEQLARAPDWHTLLRPVEDGLSDWPAIRLEPDEVELVRSGRALPFRDGARPAAEDPELWRAHDTDNAFLAVLAADSERQAFRPRKVFS